MCKKGQDCVFIKQGAFHFKKPASTYLQVHICKYTLHITAMFMCAYICILACIFTLKHSLHSNPYPVSLM